MEQDDEVSAYNEINFPSDEFLTTHFGPTRPLTPYGPDTGFRLDSHGELRRLFQDPFVHDALWMLRIQDQDNKGIKPVFLIEKGKISDWVRARLANNGIDELPAAIEQALIDEFLVHVQEHALPHEPWWHWRIEETTVWVEVTADANPMGGNRPRRTLAEMLGKTST